MAKYSGHGGHPYSSYDNEVIKKNKTTRRKKMIDKNHIKTIILRKSKENPNYLNEQLDAYDTEIALQKTLRIEFFPMEKLKAAEEVRDYLYELQEEIKGEKLKC